MFITYCECFTNYDGWLLNPGFKSGLESQACEKVAYVFLWALWFSYEELVFCKYYTGKKA